MPVSRPERKTWVLIHRWLGIGLGAWFALVGATDSVLVFRDPIDTWLNPKLLHDERRGPWLPSHAILARIADEFGLSRVERITPPAAEGEVYRLLVQVGPAMRIAPPRTEAMFSPVTGELLGTRDPDERGLSAPHLLKTIYDFHRNVLLGNAGSNIVGPAGFLLLTSALSGLIIAWPRQRSGWKRLVSVKLRAGATRSLFDVHRSAGSLLFVLLALVTVTGSTLVYVNYARDIVSVFSTVKPFPKIPWRDHSVREWPPVEKVIATVRSAYPGHAIAEIHIPTRPTGGYLFYLRRAGDVYRLGDPSCGRIPQPAKCSSSAATAAAMPANP